MMDTLKTLQLLTTTADFPFGLSERVVFSLLAYRARIALPVSKREIARETTYHRSTVRNALAHLQEVVQLDRNGVSAIEPAYPWFAIHPKRKGKQHWVDRLAARKLVIPKPKSGLSVREAAVFSMLESFQKIQDTDFSVARLSSLLNNLDGRTILVGLKNLEAKNLLRVNWNEERFTFTTCWDGAEEFFELRPPTKTPSQTVQKAESQAQIPQYTYPRTQRRFQLLLAMKVPITNAQEIITLANEVEIDDSDFDTLLAQKLSYSNEQRGSQKQLVDHPGYLIRDGLDKYRQLKKQVSGSLPWSASTSYIPDGDDEEDYDESHVHKVVQASYMECETMLNGIRRHLLKLAETGQPTYQKAITQMEKWQQQVVGNALKSLDQAAEIKATPEDFFAAVNREIALLGLNPMEVVQKPV